MKINELAFELKLPYIRQNFQMLLDEANHTKMSYQEFLQTVLEQEVILRKENSLKTRLRRAKFPIKKYLEDFDTSKYVAEIRAKFDELSTLEFISNKENIILVGSPGCGKTHYA